MGWDKVKYEPIPHLKKKNENLKLARTFKKKKISNLLVTYLFLFQTNEVGQGPVAIEDL